MSKVAVITGGANGIGLAFAKRLALTGWNLLLVDRDGVLLKQQRELFVRDFGVSVETRCSDLSLPSEVEVVANDISSRTDIEMLVNCAGFGTCSTFLEVSASTQLDMIQVHVAASIRFCHAVLPQMIKRNRGAIINIGSINAFTRFPNTSIYAASKMFIVTFTESLCTELKDTNIVCQTLCPGNTQTAFCDSKEMVGYDKSRVPKFLWMTADRVVERSLKRLQRGSGTYVVGFRNKSFIFIFGNKIIQGILGILRRFGLLEMILRLLK